MAIKTEGEPVFAAQQAVFVFSKGLPLVMEGMTGNTGHIAPAIQRHIPGNFHGRFDFNGMIPLSFMGVMTPGTHLGCIIVKGKSGHIQRNCDMAIKTSDLANLIVASKRCWRHRTNHQKQNEAGEVFHILKFRNSPSRSAAFFSTSARVALKPSP